MLQAWSVTVFIILLVLDRVAVSK